MASGSGRRGWTMPSTTGTCGAGAVAGVAACARHERRRIVASQLRIGLTHSDARRSTSFLRCLPARHLRVTVRLEVLAEEREIVPALVFLPPADDFGFHGDLHQRQAEEGLQLLERLVLLQDEIFEANRLPLLWL